MPFCMNCGNRLAETARFCSRCGTPVGSQNVQPKQVAPQQNVSAFSGIQKYTGTEKRLPFIGDLAIEVSAAKDATNEYIRQFHLYVNRLMRSFQQEYRLNCATVEGYMDSFADVNGKYVRDVADEAIGLLFSYGYYHYTAQDILGFLQETPAYKALDAFHDSNLELGNAYLQDNYNQALSKVNRMPNQTFFGTGIGGMMLSYGLSAATGAMQNKRADKMIARSQKLTRAQEQEFFTIVKEADVMYFVWDELLNVGNTVFSLLAELEPDLIAWPYQEQIDEANRVFENMQNPRFPQDQLASAAKYVLEEFPYIPDLYPFLRQVFGNTSQINYIEQYFDDPKIRLFSQVFPEYDS
ncbi:MAG: zinc ribbon domain-containing protein [Lachnospiraceae bacterium]|nr:zinc ribbon domain-containing protein [Lachnospiraceae bacterium]